MFDTILAEEELEHRIKQADLTPDRFKSLLLATGVSEKEAETARAEMEHKQLQAKNKWRR